MKKIIALIALALFIVSCAPAEFKPYKPDPINFNKTEPYSIEEYLNSLPKPEPLQRIYVKKIDDTTYQTVQNKEEATHIMLAPSEYAKVGAVVKLAATYKELALDQEKLINTYIYQINALKELLAMEQKKTEMYRELWIGSENAYRYERWEHKVDNTVHKAGLYGVTMGAILIFLLML